MTQRDDNRERKAIQTQEEERPAEESDENTSSIPPRMTDEEGADATNMIAAVPPAD